LLIEYRCTVYGLIPFIHTDCGLASMRSSVIWSFILLGAVTPYLALILVQFNAALEISQKLYNSQDALLVKWVKPYSGSDSLFLLTVANWHNKYLPMTILLHGFCHLNDSAW